MKQILITTQTKNKSEENFVVLFLEKNGFACHIFTVIFNIKSHLQIDKANNNLPLVCCTKVQQWIDL
jgi:hypothetical protein